MCDKSRNTWLCVHWQWNTRVVSTKCTPGFACRAFSDTTLVCFIVNEHTTKCSRYSSRSPFHPLVCPLHVRELSVNVLHSWHTNGWLLNMNEYEPHRYWTSSGQIPNKTDWEWTNSGQPPETYPLVVLWQFWTCTKLPNRYTRHQRTSTYMQRIKWTWPDDQHYHI